MCLKRKRTKSKFGKLRRIAETIPESEHRQNKDNGRSDNRKINITINIEMLQQVDQLKYLDKIIEWNGNIEQEIYERMSCESWLYFALNSSFRNKILALDMKNLRILNGITRGDRIRNNAVRQKLGVDSILEVVERTQLISIKDESQDESQLKNRSIKNE